MGAKNQEQGKVTFWKLDARASDGRKPHFSKLGKVNGSYVEVEQFDTLFGKLIGIELGDYDYEGEKKYKAKLKIQDKDGSLDIVDLMFNSVTYSILNTLAGADLSKEISISIYATPAKDGSAKFFANASTKIGGEKSDWKYKPVDLPKPIEAIVGTKKVKDHSPVDQFFMHVINDDIKPKLLAQTIENVADPKIDESKSFIPVDESIDLPF